MENVNDAFFEDFSKIKEEKVGNLKVKDISLGK